ncbi:MAG: hypothetical protein EBS53_00805 [Bacteroidetes bacterium]|nr:hypothetical protein [Bacteroidota bacterium]
MVCYVSITGTTTAGKTTLLRALQEASPEKVRVIPQATCRDRRPDDVDEYFRFFDQETFEKQQFATKYGKYGLLLHDMEAMRDLPEDTLCVSISGARELAQLKRVLPSYIQAYNVLVRYAGSMAAELEILHNHARNYFSGDALIERIASHTRLMEEAFFNQQYISEHIHVVLERNETLATWLKKVLHGTGSTIIPDAKQLVDIEGIVLDTATR